MDSPKAFLSPIGRLLLALPFLVAGVGKLLGPAATIGYMASKGVPAILLWPVILLELLGGIALVAGFRVPIAAGALAAFSIAAGLIFHGNFGDQMQVTMLLKDMAIAGGLLLAIGGGARSAPVVTA